jgi:hypothetical protein
MVRLAVAGNVAFIAWLLINAIDEGFRGTLPEIASTVLLTAILVLDSVLILQGRDR